MKIIIAIWVLVVAAFAIGFALDWRLNRSHLSDEDIDDMTHPPR